MENNLLNQIPDNHFGEVLHQIIRCLYSGESVVVFGMPGYGRKHLLLQIEKELRRQNRAEVVYMDFYAYGEIKTNRLEELVAKAIGISKNNFNVDLKKYFQKRQLILILGHIEAIRDNEPVWRWLRQIREITLENFAVVSSCDTTIISEPEIYERNAGELVAQQIVVLPFTQDRARKIVDINRKHFGYRTNDEAENKILNLAGGNPALIKHLAKCADDLGQEALDNYKILTSYPSLRIKLNPIIQVLIQSPLPLLRKIGLIDQHDEIFSPLIKLYLADYQLENIDKFMPELSKSEARLMGYLIMNKGQLIDKDKIYFLMGGKEEEFSLWAIYKTISRLKKKLKGKLEIKVVKGKGYTAQML